MNCPPFDPCSLPGRILSIVGAGGKTTLLYHIAQANAAAGRRVLVSTTTKIYRPRDDVFAASAAQAETLWRQGSFAVIGVPAGEKLGFCPALWKALSPKADLILIEADGAKHHPVKVPRAGEPVILPECDGVLAVAGLSALGQPLRRCCFGLEEACALLGVGPDHALTPEDAAAILSSPAGSRKGAGLRQYTVLLNQFDAAPAGGQEIADILKKQYIPVFSSWFSPEERAFYQSIARREEQNDHRT